MKKLIVTLLALAAASFFLGSCDLPGPKPDQQIVFQIDAGYRLDFASNPRIISYTDGVLGLGYEYKSPELMNNPSERGYIAFSEDRLNFTGHRKFLPGENKGPGLLLADGTFRRYTFSPEQCCFISDYSQDGTVFVEEDGIRHDLSERDDCWAGVYTVFVDGDGGVVLMYNNNVEDEITGKETIYVRKAYSAGDGLNFVFEDDDLLEIKDDVGRIMSMADPNALVLDDGRVLLITMYQDQDAPMPPKGRTGDIYGFISEDGGRHFTSLGVLFSWDDFKEFEVRSLNDPKLVRLDDGSYKIYVAAMLPLEQGEDEEYTYIMVSATWNGL